MDQWRRTGRRDFVPCPLVLIARPRQEATEPHGGAVYRDERGLYDGIASIEMFEAVGEKYWPTYFQVVRDRLKPGRNATLQIITVQDARFDTYRQGVDFIQKHIFLGGMVPSPSMLGDEVRRVGLQVHHSVEFGNGCPTQSVAGAPAGTKAADGRGLRAGQHPSAMQRVAAIAGQAKNRQQLL